MGQQPIVAAVIGATGYTGSEVVRLLSAHPLAQVCTVTSERQAGRPLRGACPWLASDLVLEPFDAESLEANVAFLCQEAGFAMEFLPALQRRMRVIDLSADFRLSRIDDYETWYGRPHTAAQCKPWPVYGLCESKAAEEIAAATAIANPGCYPTATLLALAPLSDLIDGIPVVDAKSGVSGAGRSKTETDYLFTELAGGFKPYGVTGHRHTPEIEQELGRRVRFTPHLIPAARGICSTIHVPLRAGAGRADVLGAWQSAYRDRPFVEIRTEGWPSTKEVQGSNRCVLAAAFDERTGHAVLVSVIDNLVKGAAGQAIQNMNLMFGFPEDTGLPMAGLWP
ncbi:MAG TPA: N-acetyl-gamma-glutamyl-phosphate reductase [Fimbriimonadaceae bacterium]|nr:N-acetyl-gamma-glutamyl-phosphate reductase [Fimbriimonadaceae bacterium]HRJ96311.1 N-acetyl-gamma-glutamyl-phosphate reductase [Fimbriimonadaceae bacterium]